MLRSYARGLCAALSLVAVLLLVGGPPQARAVEQAKVGPFLDDVLANVDTYWHQTDAANGRPAPSVHHAWVVPGGRVDTACGAQADDTAAFYCPVDDTIYIGEQFAGALSNGTLTSLPSRQGGLAHAAGDFAVAYVVAHEYGHNVQQESGTLGGRTRALPVELNADCLAGTWAKWAFGQGRLKQSDVQQAIDAAYAFGDFEYLSPQHHGTPQERRDALMTGLKSGSPSACDTYLLR